MMVRIRYIDFKTCNLYNPSLKRVVCRPRMRKHQSSIQVNISRNFSKQVFHHHCQSQYLDQTVRTQLLFSFGTFDSFLADLVWAEIECWQVHVALPKRTVNKFKQVQQSRPQALRAYCPKIYTVLSVQLVDSSTFSRSSQTRLYFFFFPTPPQSEYNTYIRISNIVEFYQVQVDFII